MACLVPPRRIARLTEGYADKREYFVDLLAQGAGRIAAAFHPREVIEIPSNVLLAAEFSQIFDGFSIGSNDLTQLVLGVDRDSPLVAPVFNERSPAVQEMVRRMIEEAHRAGRKVGICGQAPSDYPEFAAFLVECGIDSISLNPDAVLPTLRHVAEVEKAKGPQEIVRGAA